MAEINENTRLEQHFTNIEVTAIADLRTLASNGGGMGVFFLGTPIIDALAKAYAKKGASWREFVTAFMPAAGVTRSYEPLAGLLHQEFRNPGAHNLSASARFRFTSGPENRHMHLLEVDGIWHLHAGCFAEDVEAAFNALRNRTQSDPTVRGRVLAWFDKHPPVGPVRLQLRPPGKADSA